MRLGLFALLLVLLLPARIEIQDEEVFLNTALGILETGLPVYRAEGLVFYQRYSPIYATILAAHLAVAQPLAGLLSSPLPGAADVVSWGLVLGFNVLIALVLARLMDHEMPRARGFWIMGLASSFTLFYATTLFMDLLLAVVLFLASMLAARGRWMAAALALALLSLLKLTNLVYLPALALVVGLAPGTLGRPRAATGIAALLLAAGIPAVFHLAFNHVARGNLFDFGYASVYPDPLTGEWVRQGFTHSPFRGLLGFLASPGKSLFLYAPLTLPGLLGLARGWRAGEPRARIAAVMAATTVALYAGWSQWEGGMCYGPRLLLPAVPLLLAGLAWFPLDTPRARRAILALALWGILVNVSARLLPIFPAYLASGSYGTGGSFPLAHNFLADQAEAARGLGAALRAQPPVNAVPALLAAVGLSPADAPLAWRGILAAWLAAVSVLAVQATRPAWSGSEKAGSGKTG